MIALTPADYHPLREAISEIAAALVAGRENSPAIKKVLAGGYSPPCELAELEEAADVFWAKYDKEKVAVFVEHPTSGTILKIESQWLGGIPYFRRYQSGGNLSLVRPAHPLHKHMVRVFGQNLAGIQLLVKASELQPVLRELRRTRKRKNIRGQATSPGRPSRIAEAKPAVLKLVENGKWDGSQSLKKLHHLLSRPPFKLVVSESTLSRALDDLAAGGERKCQRMKKKRQGSAQA